MAKEAVIVDVVFHEEELRLPSGEIEALEHIHLVELNVHREQLEAFGDVGLFEDGIKGADRDVDLDSLVLEPRRGLAVKGGPARILRMNPEFQSFSLILATGAGAVENAARAFLSKSFGEGGNGLHQHAAPAGSFDDPARRSEEGIVRSDIDVDSVAAVVEESAEEGLLLRTGDAVPGKEASQSPRPSVVAIRVGRG